LRRGSRGRSGSHHRINRATVAVARAIVISREQLAIAQQHAAQALLVLGLLRGAVGEGLQQALAERAEHAASAAE